MKNKSLSIILMAYNAETEIGRLIESVQEQDYKGKTEIIVTDDNSSDNTAKIVKEYAKKDKRMRLISNKKNKGYGATLNPAVRAAKNEIIITFHQDMVLPSKNYVSKIMKFFEDERVVACEIPIVTPEEVWEKYEFWHKVFTVNFTKPMKDMSYFLAYRKDALLKIGLFDTRTFRTAGEDIDANLKIREHGRVETIDEAVKHLEGAHRASLKKQILKQYQYGEPHGVLVRRYGFRMRGIKLVVLKTVLLGLLIVPGVNFLALLALLVIGALPLKWTLPRIKDWRLVFLPFANVLRYAVYTYAFWRGFLTEKAYYKY